MIDQLIIQPGQPAGKDTWMGHLNPNSNFGGGALLIVGYTAGGSVRRILGEYTLPLPLTADNLRSLTWRLQCITAALSAEPGAVHRGIRHTGYAGGAWEEDKATWNQYTNVAPSPAGDWDVQGGDYNPVEGVQLCNLPTVTGQYDITGARMLAFGQDAITNRGRQLSLLFKRTVEEGTVASANFASADNATAAWWPQLIATFETGRGRHPGMIGGMLQLTGEIRG